MEICFEISFHTLEMAGHSEKRFSWVVFPRTHHRDASGDTMSKIESSWIIDAKSMMKSCVIDLDSLNQCIFDLDLLVYDLQYNKHGFVPPEEKRIVDETDNVMY